MALTQRRYDCYQISLQIKLSEEESCLYNKYGLSLFNVSKLGDGEPCDCVNTPIPDLPVGYIDVPTALVLDVNIDSCDCTKATFTIFVRLACKCTVVPNSTVNFEGASFALTSEMYGRCRQLTIFEVNPLPTNVVSRAINNEHVFFEITRVPDRFASPNITINSVTYVCGKDVALPVGGNSLRITFPLTKDLKSMIPDFGLSGSLLNFSHSPNVRTKVRVMSYGPVKFALPAMLSFNKDSCTVTLEIDLDYIANNRNDIIGYEQLFGSFGCGIASNCASDLRGATLLNEIIDEYLTLDAGDAAAKFFRLLASSKKLDLTGVDKCVEKVLFSFQLCYLPWKNIAFGDCNNKYSTQIIDSDPADPLTDPTDIIHSQYILRSNNFGSISSNSGNAYTVEADGHYSYEYSVITHGPI